MSRGRKLTLCEDRDSVSTLVEKLIEIPDCEHVLYCLLLVRSFLVVSLTDLICDVVSAVGPSSVGVTFSHNSTTVVESSSQLLPMHRFSEFGPKLLLVPLSVLVLKLVDLSTCDDLKTEFASASAVRLVVVRKFADLSGASRHASSLFRSFLKGAIPKLSIFPISDSDA